MQREEGFTLMELMVVCMISAILLTLSATAARHYWFVQALDGAQDSVAGELREVQERSRSQSHPVAYGLRVRPGSAPGSSSEVGVVRYDYGSGSCSQVSTTTLDAGVYVSAADFTVISPGPTQSCRAAISGASADQFVFMFARGTASGGSLTLRHRDIGGSRTIAVSQLTGRVSES